MIWTAIVIVCTLIFLSLIILRSMIKRGGQGVTNEDPLSFLNEPITDSQVVRLPNNDRVISWQQPGAKAVFVSTNHEFSAQEELDSLSGEFRYIHTQLKSNARCFYSIHHKNNEPTYVAERIWELTGVLNLRDIGGYKTAEGKFTRWGKVYRTAHLGDLTDESLELLSQQKISLVCDLRSDRELNENPDRVPVGAAYHHTPIYKEDQLSGIFPKLLFDRAALGDQLGAGYIRMLDERAEVFADIIGRFADPANLPAMFHCTAGKDRAGLTTAMLLSLLDVPRETIIADYTLSNLASNKMYEDFMGKSGGQITRFGVPPEQLKPLFLANPQWLENALQHLDRQYGGVRSYLTEQGGLPNEKIEELRKNLLI